MRRLYRAIAIGLASMALAVVPAALPVSAGVANNDTIRSLSLSGSPFAADFAPLPTSVTAKLVLTRRARVTARVYTAGGLMIRSLVVKKRLAAGTHSWSWDGRNATGQQVPDGEYELRVKTTNGLGTLVEERQLRKGMPAIYPANSGAIVIVVDPGHGGQYLGACNRRTCEKTFNLDISLKLRALLRKAGVEVVMTRTSDSPVNTAGSDLNGDGLTNGYDDLTARNDIANLARGDLNIHNHNNGSACRCERGSEIFTNFHQPWTSANNVLATHLWREQLVGLDQFSDGTYYPIDRGLKDGDYYYMAPYATVCPIAAGAHPECYPPWLPRPVLMPSVLTESLFMQDPIEFALLSREDVRLALAASYYLAIAEYINARPLGIGYKLLDGPSPSVSVGSSLSYRLRVTNRGNEASSGWQLQLRNVPAVPVYDGSGQAGVLMGEVQVPDGLQPGGSVDLEITAVAPAAAGNWLVKADVRLADSSVASAAGIVALQAPLTTTGP